MTESEFIKDLSELIDILEEELEQEWDVHYTDGVHNLRTFIYLYKISKLK